MAKDCQLCIAMQQGPYVGSLYTACSTCSLPHLRARRLQLSRCLYLSAVPSSPLQTLLILCVPIMHRHPDTPRPTSPFPSSSVFYSSWCSSRCSQAVQVLLGKRLPPLDHRAGSSALGFSAHSLIPCFHFLPGLSANHKAAHRALARQLLRRAVNISPESAWPFNLLRQPHLGLRIRRRYRRCLVVFRQTDSRLSHRGSFWRDC